MSVRQIARLAHLSPGAVSLALRNSSRISAATRRRVMKIAARIGYRPDAKVNELMSRIRLSHTPASGACLGVVSLYPSARPWEESLHLQRIYQGMTQCAEALGYQLNPLWLRAPKMTDRRFQQILDARGIEGLLCFGSPEFEEEFPPGFDRYAVVTQGLSIKTPLHRVVSHVYNDMWRALNKVRQLGYRRPGLVIGKYEETRSAHAYLCVYLGWSHLVLGTPSDIPVLQLAKVEEKPLMVWLGQHRPDVLIFVHHYDMITEFDRIVRRQGIRVPAELGVVVVSQTLEGTDFSGLQENQLLIGTRSVQLLVSQIVNRDFGIPDNPRIEMVERRWVDGKSLKRQPR